MTQKGPRYAPTRNADRSTPCREALRVMLLSADRDARRELDVIYPTAMPAIIFSRR